MFVIPEHMEAVGDERLDDRLTMFFLWLPDSSCISLVDRLDNSTNLRQSVQHTKIKHRKKHIWKFINTFISY